MLVHTHPVLVKFPALHAYRQHVPEFLVIRYTLSTHTTMHFCLYTNCFHLLSLPTPLKVVLWQAGCACMRIKENRGVCSACIMRALHREGRRWCAIFTLDCHLAYILLYLPPPHHPLFFPEVYGCNCCDAGSYSKLCTPPSGYTVVHTHYAHASSAQQCTIYNTLAVARAASKSFKPASSIFSLSTKPQDKP